MKSKDKRNVRKAVGAALIAASLLSACGGPTGPFHARVSAGEWAACHAIQGEPRSIVARIVSSPCDKINAAKATGGIVEIDDAGNVQTINFDVEK